METIQIKVTEKRAQALGSPVIVCGNSDYKVQFDFDNEWADQTVKTARFAYVKNGAVGHQDVVFEGDTARVPVLSDIREVRVGVFAGNLVTTTPAVIPCEPSILCGSGAPEAPSKDVYRQLMALYNQKVLEFGSPVENEFDPTSTNAQSGQAVADAIANLAHETPFKTINLPLTKAGHSYRLVDGVLEKVEEENCSPIVKCPKYLGFRIGDDETRIYIYIGTMENGEFMLDENYHIDTTDTGAVNYLRQSHNRFIETDGDKYFYYKVNKGSDVTLMGCDEFPQGESEVIATTTTIVKNDGTRGASTTNYYSIVLPSGCFYAVLNKKGMPTFLNPDDADEDDAAVLTFNTSYQTGVDANEEPIIEINRGASFGVIPENVGAALLRLPHTYKLDDLCIYTDKVVKSNARSGRRRTAKELGEKIINFNFLSQKDIFWNDSTHPMNIGRRFYGVPYSSRWVNSHYIGFEVTPETAINALNDPYSIAYDGGYYYQGGVPTRYSVSPSDGEIVNQYDEQGQFLAGGGPGYGLVCSAFTNLISGNPYPQSNRGYTFDSNFALEHTTDMNSGEVLVNKGLSHCVFVDEIYNDGFSLYEATDPCAAKTTHTCPPDKTTYAASRVRNTSLDKYIYSVINKDTSGYEKEEPLLNFENFTVPNGKARPWRGNKAVYGSWDKVGQSKQYSGSGIGVTLHEGITSFILETPSGEIKTIKKADNNDHYVDISAHVTESGTYRVSDGNVSEYFRYYDHDTVQLTFDAEGKAVFKNSDGSIADDVEYIYVEVQGYGGAFGEDASLDQTKAGAMVIAAGKCYPDLALDTSRIVDIRAAIVSDPDADFWGKYSCATSSVVVSEYKGGDFATKDYVDEAIKGIESGGSDYTLPIGGDELGGVKNGGNVVINEDGTMTVSVDVTDGKDGISATHSWNGTILTVTSASGTSSADLKGDKGDTGASGSNGKDGTSVTVSKVTESTADGGSNVVTFSDGKTLTIKNGSKGSKGVDGYTPQKGVDYYTEEDKAEMVNDVKNVCVTKNQGSENVGKILVVGTDGNLTLADMPEGGASGDVIGVLDESNNILLSGNLSDGKYTLKYENTDGTYTEVGELVIGEIEPPKTNFFVVGGDGYLNPGRASSSGADRTDVATCLLSNYIEVQNGDIVSVEGMVLTGSLASNSGFYNASKTGINGNKLESATSYVKDVSFSDNGGQFTINNADVGYIRICGAIPSDVNAIVVNIQRNGEWL